MSCYKCRFYTGEDLAACGWNPHIAASSPEEGCYEFQPDPNPWGFWEGKLLNPPHIDSVQIGWVPVDGWKQLSCEINSLIFEDQNFSFVDNEVIGNSIWRDRNGVLVGYAQAWAIERRKWYQNPDPMGFDGAYLLWKVAALFRHHMPE